MSIGPGLRCAGRAAVGFQGAHVLESSVEEGLLRVEHTPQIELAEAVRRR